jgi:heme-degrading monooxygenase HmoA
VQVHPQEVLVFARVISAQNAADLLDRAIRIAQQQLPGIRDQPGFSGFYLLADRTSGKLMTISLWQSREDLRRVKSRSARLRSKAAGEIEIGVNTPRVDIYEVAVQA